MIDITVIIPLYKGKKYLTYWTDILPENFKKFEQEYKMRCEAVFVNDYPEEKIELQVQDMLVSVINLKENHGMQRRAVPQMQYSKTQLSK